MGDDIHSSAETGRSQLTRLGAVPLGAVANLAAREKGTDYEWLGASASAKA